MSGCAVPAAMAQSALTSKMSFSLGVAYRYSVFNRTFTVVSFSCLLIISCSWLDMSIAAPFSPAEANLTGFRFIGPDIGVLVSDAIAVD
jgi:hypothetical protein